MKTILLALLLIFLAINLYADKKWIKIEPANKTKTQALKADAKLDVDLAQIKPINNMIKNATIIKQLIEKKRKEKPTTNDKTWFVLNAKDSK